MFMDDMLSFFVLIVGILFGGGGFGGMDLEL